MKKSKTLLVGCIAVLKRLAKPLLYILAFCIIVSGFVCGALTYKIITSKSYINGDMLGIENAFKQEDFRYKTNAIMFRKSASDSNLYTYEIELNPVKDFNGVTNRYEILLNGYEILTAVIQAGAIEFTQAYEFLDVQGEEINQAQLQVSVEMLADKTRLRVQTETEHIEYINQYFNNNQFELRINKIKEKTS